MIKIIDFIRTIKQEYDTSQIPFLSKQLERVSITKPYKGLKILHNIPFTKETIVKLEILYAGGADITVRSPSFMEAAPALVDEFKKAGGCWKENNTEDNSCYDIFMDCAGELLDHVSPKIGVVEITGTGTQKYRLAEVEYPVISVDQSEIKKLEAMLGTGEAFVRAFQEITREQIHNKEFMIFGFGKVGKGITRYLSSFTNKITIIDKSSENLMEAKKLGFKTIKEDNKEIIESLAPKMFAIVTATGVKDVISKNYNPQYFLNSYLANMGGEDEFGFAFDIKDVLCDKKPINFFINHPTLIKYLDPVFYAHNMGVDLLLFANLKNGLHPFPNFLSEEIVLEWESIFKEKLYPKLTHV
ncbi:NAD-binding protein [Aquimarina sp. 2201CG5-10]|uniref:NAD-binding protein n=1 Tax=Aquimarina callyspongiae TaxID=3098150 RepID=UPI002AB4E15C|nr:NAD-binding protein [Aquimarina sp. 2201CG5-10]MDY8134332.1 NAD-binding protein [Aquimarina sp. 2201CG5-10]